MVSGATADDVSVRGSYSGTAELNASLVDQAGRATDPKDAIGSDLDAGQVNHIDASDLVDGAITVRAYTEVSGIRSAWANANATKDATAPSTPLSPVVRAGANNGTNVINSANVHDVRVGANMSADAAWLDVTLEDSHHDDVAVTLPADGSRGLDASALADGDITLTVIAKDAAGNSSGSASTTLVGKDTVAVRIPNHEFLNKLLKKIDVPLAQTSVNISGKHPLDKIDDIIKQFGKANILIINGGDIRNGKASKVIDATKDTINILRP